VNTTVIVLLFMTKGVVSYHIPFFQSKEACENTRTIIINKGDTRISRCITSTVERLKNAGFKIEAI